MRYYISTDNKKKKFRFLDYKNIFDNIKLSKLIFDVLSSICQV